jgi:very-short-patch-repair endonuclease
MKTRSGTCGKTRRTLPLEGARCEKIVKTPPHPSLSHQGRGKIYRNTRKNSLPLEGGGKRVGVKALTGIARKLRKQSTDTEQHLWRHLRNRQIEGFKFRRQQPVGGYFVDFVNLEKKVIIELDGGQHALGPGDKVRDEWLRAEGYKVLRFWDNQIFNNLEGVLETIRDALLALRPDPLLQGERGDNLL